ncbi:MAG TPA: nuclear transport factor 2 family protein [Thermoanaerobaculia bacterium]|nr:nuclear transport factor 2 family protein [Thermoanaerobaculia bacterium]
MRQGSNSCAIWNRASPPGALVLVALLLVLGSSLAPDALDAHGLQPIQVVESFHAALEEQEKEKALELLLPDATIFEGGIAETVEQYAAHHLMGDMAFAAATKGELLEQSKQVVGDVAWVMTRSHRSGTFRDREIDSIGVETVVLRHVEAGWRIAHIHWSSRRRE